MSALDDLRAYLNELRAELQMKQQEKARYMATANSIDVVYRRMATDKKTIKSYRDSLDNFYKERYDRFSGNLYKETYLASISQLISDYDTVISRLDTNMDRLNTAKAQWENQAYQCDGIIGYLRSGINSVIHQIENWVN